MRQLGFGILDLRLHMTYDPKRDGDVLTYAREQMKSFTPAPLPSDYAMIAGFTHIFSSPVGYAGGYYSYKWAEVLEADAFSRFADDGVFSEVVGMEFRERILAKGDSEDPANIVPQFHGQRSGCAGAASQVRADSVDCSCGGNKYKSGRTQVVAT